eukprot:1388702-Prymnesium_polylepis.1
MAPPEACTTQAPASGSRAPSVPQRLQRSLRTARAERRGRARRGPHNRRNASPPRKSSSFCRLLRPPPNSLPATAQAAS